MLASQRILSILSDKECPSLTIIYVSNKHAHGRRFIFLIVISIEFPVGTVIFHCLYSTQVVSEPVGEVLGVVIGVVKGVVIGVVKGVVIGVVKGVVKGVVMGVIMGVVIGVVMGVVMGMVMGVTVGSVALAIAGMPVAVFTVMAVVCCVGAVAGVLIVDGSSNDDMVI